MFVYEKMYELYEDWNSKINLISRKDFQFFYERHVLHSLGIAKVMKFRNKSRVLDVGTGGGFPGIPLAIFFPETDFFLIDGVGKKIKVVKEISKKLGLSNVFAEQIRSENFNKKVDFVVSRAVVKMNKFIPDVKMNISKAHNNKFKNGIFYLKGGDLKNEISLFPKLKEFDLSLFFESTFFQTKKVVYIPL